MRYELCRMIVPTSHAKGVQNKFTKTYFDTDSKVDALYELGRYMARAKKRGVDFAILDGGEPVIYGRGAEDGGTVYITTSSGSQKVVPLKLLDNYCRLLEIAGDKIRDYDLLEQGSDDDTEGMTNLEIARRRASINKTNKGRRRGEGLTGAEKYDIKQAIYYDGRAGAIDAIRKIKRNREVRDRQYGRDFPNA